MRTLTKRLFAGLATTFISLGAMAQEAQFSQFYASSLYLNPALAGLERDMTFNSNFRSQWRTLGGAFNTMQLSGIMPFYNGIDKENHLGGVGLSLYNDQGGGGLMSTVGASISGAYGFGVVNELNRISIGAQIGLYQNALDLSRLQPGQQFSDIMGYNPALPFSDPSLVINNTRTYPVVNAGAVWSYNPSRNYYKTGTSGYLGIAASNLNSPAAGFVESGNRNLPLLTKVHGGLELHLNKRWNLSPNFLLANQAGLNQINVGAYLTYKMVEYPFGLFGNSDLVFGGWYRANDAGILSVGITNPAYSFGFSYDMNTTRLQGFTQNQSAYEFSFSIRNVKENKRRRFDTPRI